MVISTNWVTNEIICIFTAKNPLKKVPVQDAAVVVQV